MPLTSRFACFTLCVGLLSPCLPAMSAPIQALPPAPLPQLTGLAMSPVVAPPKGKLMIIGGGKLPASIIQRIIELAGGPQARILIMPHASGVPEESAEFSQGLFRAQGAQQVEIYACKAGAMDTPPCLQQLANAGGVFFTGGDQNLLTKAFSGTKAFERIQALYRKGAVLAGTSAGAAVMSEVMITGEEKRPASEAPITPFDTIRKQRVITAAGFGFVNRYIIDQHFILRMRQNRLISTVLDHPSLVGVGIDESTGILVSPDQSFEVVGDSNVFVVDARQAEAIQADERQSWSARNLRVHLLTAGQKFSP